MIVTLSRITSLEIDLQTAVNPLLAAVDKPIVAKGDLTCDDVILTILPNLRLLMPGKTALNKITGTIKFSSRPRLQSSSDQSENFPGGGPPLLFTKISGSGHASIRFVLPCVSLRSATTRVTLDPVSFSIFREASASLSWFLPLIKTVAPSRTRDLAHANPRPWLDAQTIAFFPRNPKSITVQHTRRRDFREFLCEFIDGRAGEI